MYRVFSLDILFYIIFFKPKRSGDWDIEGKGIPPFKKVKISNRKVLKSHLVYTLNQHKDE